MVSVQRRWGNCSARTWRYRVDVRNEEFDRGGEGDMKYQATCRECLWKGPIRDTKDEAGKDAWDHSAKTVHTMEVIRV